MKQRWLSRNATGHYENGLGYNYQQLQPPAEGNSRYFLEFKREID